MEADGSVYFRAPADRPIYFAALDENFMEVQRMRAFTQVQPGETLSCVDCHEPRTTAPPNRAPLALRRPPADITPPPDGVHAPDFYYDIQPVLNRHCVRCHSGPEPSGDLDLSPDWTNLFNVAYENLRGRGLVSYVDARRSDALPLRAPKYYGSHDSKLIGVLRKTHPDRVQPPPEDLCRLVTWIGCNAPLLRDVSLHAAWDCWRPRTADSGP